MLGGKVTAAVDSIAVVDAKVDATDAALAKLVSTNQKKQPGHRSRITSFVLPLRAIPLSFHADVSSACFFFVFEIDFGQLIVGGVDQRTKRRARGSCCAGSRNCSLLAIHRQPNPSNQPSTSSRHQSGRQELSTVRLLPARGTLL